ncbi:hypothetical protein O5478_17945 [Escherichia coli]|nr:hypothetical protein [Escherichia coli]
MPLMAVQDSSRWWASVEAASYQYTLLSDGLGGTARMGAEKSAKNWRRCPELADVNSDQQDNGGAEMNSGLRPRRHHGTAGNRRTSRQQSVK